MGRLVQVIEREVVDAALHLLAILKPHTRAVRLTSRNSFLRITKKPIKSRVSLVKIRSASPPHMSSAAARMAGATTSRVVFINSSASHSKTFWMI
jgi:hypothetical protein